jgi:hypothetical protein
VKTVGEGKGAPPHGRERRERRSWCHLDQDLNHVTYFRTRGKSATELLSYLLASRSRSGFWLWLPARPPARPHKVLVTCLLRVETWNWDINRSTLNQDMKLRHQLVDTSLETWNWDTDRSVLHLETWNWGLDWLIPNPETWNWDINWLIPRSWDMTLRPQQVDSKSKYEIETSIGRFPSRDMKLRHRLVLYSG